MSADISLMGVAELEAKIAEKFGEAKINAQVNKVLKEVADKSVERLKSNMSKAYKDTGISSDGVNHGNVSRASGEAIIKIGNNGEHWRLIHLNEFGYTREGIHYPGAGNGVMKNFVENEKSIVFEEVKEGLRGLL